MFRLAHSPKARPLPRPLRAGRLRGRRVEPQRAVYGRSFWFAYAANTALMMSVSLLFRYADFVTLLGGGELTLGLIVGIGMIGSFAARLAQGVSIDRYGPRRVWLVSLAIVVSMLASHLVLTSVSSPAIYLVRIAYASGIAGAFGASITYVSLRAPAARMAEMIGVLGSSGFVGMAVGTQLGDALCGISTLQRWHLDRMFFVAAVLAALAFVCAWIATRGDVRPLARRRPPMLWLLRRYHPGPMLMMGLAMGMGLGLPSTFLRPYTESLGIATIGTFFGIYAATAFSARILLRRVPDRIGVRTTILLGMAALVSSMLLYLAVRSPWTLVFPGVAVGLAHAMLFPAVMAGGSRTFPTRYRGLGTTLILGSFDLGNLIGMPLAGTIVDTASYVGLPPYPTMFLTFAGILLIASISYTTLSRESM